MSAEANIKLENSNGCAPRNALLCCRSPACLNYEPKLPQPVHTTNMSGPDQETNHTSGGALDYPHLSPLFHATAGSLMHHDMAGSDSPRCAQSPPSQQRHQPSSPPPTDKVSNAINKSQSAIDVRHGVTLRRVSPPKRTITVKPEPPMMGVVLRKVEKKSLLELPKPSRFGGSPPPKKLTSKAKAKNQSAASNNPTAIPKSKSTNDVALIAKQKQEATTSKVAVVPKINLLKVHRPPLEIHKIEGDKIIIIRRIPRSKRPKEALPALPLQLGPNQVTNINKPKKKNYVFVPL